MKQYRITIFEKWQYGTQWCQVIGTTCIDTLRNDLKKRYNRFKIEEIT